MIADKASRWMPSGGFARWYTGLVLLEGGSDVPQGSGMAISISRVEILTGWHK